MQMQIKELQASYRYLAEIVIYSIGQQEKLPRRLPNIEKYSRVQILNNIEKY